MRLALLVVVVLGGTPATAAAEPPATHYLVTLNSAPGPQSVDVAHKVAAQYGGTVRHVYRHALAGYAVIMTNEQASRVAADPAVDQVTLDEEATVVRESPQLSPRLDDKWHLDRINQRTPELDGYLSFNRTGSGVTIYIVDTGIRTTHSEFEGRASLGPVFAPPATCNALGGHGTMVASVAGGRLQGAAKEAKLVSVQSTQCNGSGKVSDAVAAVDWITGHAVRPAVVNMSVGFYEWRRPQALHDAVANSIANGLTYVAAASNEKVDACKDVPARVPGVISVGGSTLVDGTDQMWAYTGAGSCVDILAPATNITTAMATGDNDFTQDSGNSFAAPLVAAAAAMYLQTQPDAPPAEVANALIGRSIKDKIAAMAANTPNRLLYVGPDCGRVLHEASAC